MDLLLFGFKVVMVLICKDEIQGQEPCVDELEFMGAPVPNILPADRGIKLSGKQVINSRILAIDFSRGVLFGEELPRERIGAVSALHGGEIQVLLCGEIAGVRGDNIKKPGLCLGVAKDL